LEEELKCINTCAWEEKKQIQLEQELAHLRNTNPVERFTQIKRACVAIAVSKTTVGELDHDETQATLAALSLQAETNNIDSYVSALDQMKEQEIKIQKLTQEFDELWRDRPLCMVFVASTQSLTAPPNHVSSTTSTAQPPTMINTMMPDSESKTN